MTRRPDLDSPIFWAGILLVLTFWAVVACLWILWALVVLPIAGVAALCKNKDFAKDALRTLSWSK